MTDPLNIVGNAFGAYHIVSFRRGGAFGLVYQAMHGPTGSMVALKILRPTAGWPQIREFNNEGDLLLKMTGASSVLDILDTGSETINVMVAGGTARFPIMLRYHVLELADGCLDELLADLGALDWSSRLRLFRDVVLGLHQMHLRKLVHRDLKAANCLLFRQGKGLKVKLNDLGRSRDLTQSAGALPLDYAFGRGDPDFAAPELLWGLGDNTAKTYLCADLYGAGSVFYELAVGQGITGQALFPQAQTVMAHHALPLDQRRMAYHARLAEIRGWYEPMFELFDSGTPKAIRQQAGRLIRQLCDPDPMRRLPNIAPGRRGFRPNELGWLLNRVDVLRLTLNNDLKQTQGLRLRKGV